MGILSPSNLFKKNRSSGETNTESVQTPEEQTREHERAIIELKRTRNSLLNIYKLPPELLGDIFRRNVAPMIDFSRWPNWIDRTHNFLFVCHRWFEISTHTPEVWGFWGTSLKEWKLCCRHSGSAPLDLVLDGNPDDGDFDLDLRKILQDRATKDTIRQICLRAEDRELLNSVISSLTVNREGFQSSSLESFTLLNRGAGFVDLPNFFAHCRFPKLQHLELSRNTTVQWSSLSFRTGALTTLIVDYDFYSTDPIAFIPTASERLSMLASNPALEKVRLDMVPPLDGSMSSVRVSLHNLKHLGLAGDVRDVLGVLHLLDHPSELDLSLSLYNCAVGDISRIVSPYLRDYVGRRSRPQNGLGVYLIGGGDVIGYNVSDVDTLDPSKPSNQMPCFLFVYLSLDEMIPDDLLERAIMDSLAHIPQEEVVYFCAFKEPLAMEAMSAHFPNIKVLRLERSLLSVLSNLSGDREIFPSLQHIYLDYVVVDDDDWSPLTTFLARLTSSGNQLDTLEIFYSPHMCVEVVEKIRKVVRHFRTEPPNKKIWCPFDTCPDP